VGTGLPSRFRSVEIGLQADACPWEFGDSPPINFERRVNVRTCFHVNPNRFRCVFLLQNSFQVGKTQIRRLIQPKLRKLTEISVRKPASANFSEARSSSGSLHLRFANVPDVFAQVSQNSGDLLVPVPSPP